MLTVQNVRHLFQRECVSLYGQRGVDGLDAICPTQLQGIALLKADDIILTVSEEEKAFLKRLGGSSNVVDISTGYKEGDVIKILSGPMVGLEGHIIHVDRHKRLVTINVSLFGRSVKTTLGLELTYKKPEVPSV